MCSGIQIVNSNNYVFKIMKKCMLLYFLIRIIGKLISCKIGDYKNKKKVKLLKVHGLSEKG